MDVFGAVRSRAAKYRALTDVYDAELLKAHDCGYGTPEMLEHLRAANSLAKDVTKALELYQTAVAELAASLNTGNDW